MIPSRSEFAENINELLDIKGNLFLYFILCYLLIYSSQLYVGSHLNWYWAIPYDVVSLFTSFIGAFFLSIWINLIFLYINLKTICIFSFNEIERTVSNEIQKIEEGNPNTQPVYLLVGHIFKTVISPVTAGIICLFIPIIGGFLIAPTEKLLTNTLNHKLLKWQEGSSKKERSIDSYRNFLQNTSFYKQGTLATIKANYYMFSVILFGINILMISLLCWLSSSIIR
ncbi:hypothetical protein OAH12_01475 [Cyclobacteriaceae bacterium]|nr:hypothetical protein [Cyclobacteriaceae bacterium]